MSIYGLFKYFVVYALHGYSMVLLKRNDKISSLQSGKPVTPVFNNEIFLPEAILLKNVTLILA